MNQVSTEMTCGGEDRLHSRTLWAVRLAGLISIVLSVFLIAGSVPFTGITFVVPYAAEGPGPTYNTLGDVDGVPVVEVTGADVDVTRGNLNMTTVSVRTNMTLLQALQRWAMGDEIVPISHVIPENMTPEDMEEENKAAFVASEAGAKVAALRYLGRPTDVVVHDTVKDSAAMGVLEAGDVLLDVDGVAVTEPGQVQDIVRSHAPGEALRMRINRGGDTRDVEVTLKANPDEPDQAQVGILMTSEPANGVEVTFNLTDVGGPSAGMMFALAVIDKLSPGLLNGGKFVAGTGTIDEDGTVGPIGGISHKIAAAKKEGAQLFLAPAGNCAEVLRADAGSMTVASVATLDDAIRAMQDFTAGRDVVACQAR